MSLTDAQLRAAIREAKAEGDTEKAKRLTTNLRARQNRREYASVMSDCGLVRGKTSTGRTIWE